MHCQQYKNNFKMYQSYFYTCICVFITSHCVCPSEVYGILFQKFPCLKHAFVCTLYRDATNEMALHFLAKMKILVVRDIERNDVEFICKVGVVQWVWSYLFLKQ